MSTNPQARPAFGTVLADQMSIATCKGGRWSADEIVATAPIPMHPAAHVLHYASTCFEGFKAYRWHDGSIHVFRMDKHIERMRQSARLLSLPQPDAEQLARMVLTTIDRVRAQLVGLLRTQGKFADAAKQADELIAANPRALEPRMAKALVLDEWAAQDREKYDAAVAQWTEVRTLLGRLQRKPPEYYTAVFRTADCLYRQAKLSKDASKLLQAEQVLKSTLVMYSKAMGQDMFAQYKDLLGRIAAAKGKK